MYTAAGVLICNNYYIEEYVCTLLYNNLLHRLICCIICCHEGVANGTSIVS